MPEPKNLLVFETAGRRWALSAEQVQEIVPMAELTSSPGQPSLLEGFLNLRGVAVPVVRLDRLFGLPAIAPGLYTPLVVLKGARPPAAFLVERVLDLVTSSPATWQALEESASFNGCAKAQFESQEGPVTVLAAERLLLEQERRRLADLREQAQRRIDGLEVRPA